jgi:hypothetical protein
MRSECGETIRVPFRIIEAFCRMDDHPRDAASATPAERRRALSSRQPEPHRSAAPAQGSI